MWLSKEQVEELTQRKRYSAQIKVLVESGIPFKVVAGRPIVVEKALYESEKKVRRLAPLS